MAAGCWGMDRLDADDELLAEIHVARAIDLHDRKDPLAAVEEYNSALSVAPEGQRSQRFLSQGHGGYLGNKFDMDLLRKDWQAVVDHHSGPLGFARFSHR